MSTERQWMRATRYLAGGQIDAAKAALESLLIRDFSHTQAHLTLGGIAWRQGRIRDATRHALDALRNHPADPHLLCDIVAALAQVGEVVAARSLLDLAALKDSKSIPVLMRLSGLCQQWGEHTRALRYLQEARSAGAQGADFHCFFGVQLSFNGRLSEAELELNACLDLNPAAGRAALMLARLRKQTPEQNHLSRLKLGLQRTQEGSEDLAALHFALYKEYEDLGQFDHAWHALQRGNAIMRSRLSFAADAETDAFDALIGLCKPEFLTSTADKPDGPLPIFIVGLPRSGTTLLERILGNHPDVACAGELGDFSRQLNWAADCLGALPLDRPMVSRLHDVDFTDVGRRYLAQTQWRADGKRYFIDKLPANWAVAGLLHRALPQAPILHLRRGSRDVCFSNYRALFGDSYRYSYDQVSLAAHYLQYRRLMAHWHTVIPGRIHDVAYTDLVRDTESAARKAFAFCGLDFDPAFLDIARNKTAVATLSMAQVRSGIRTSGEEWRPYINQLTLMFTALQSA